MTARPDAQHSKNGCDSSHSSASACSAWLAGWYATKLHAVPSATQTPDHPWTPIESRCGAWVYITPRTEWAARRIENGLPRCKHCERIIKQNVKAQGMAAETTRTEESKGHKDD